MPVPRLIVFSDATRAEPALMLARFAELGQRAEPRSVLFVLRDYALSTRARWQLAQRLAELTSRAEQLLGVADRADFARALGCAGLHLPEAGISARDARHYLGPEVFLSRACHDPANPVEPELDARLVSPIFEARKGRPALGLAAWSAQVGQGGCASFALGGVDAGNAGACLAAGAAGVAVIGAALTADPGALLSALGILRV